MSRAPLTAAVARVTSEASVDFWLQRLSPLAAVRRVHARVVGLARESPRSRTLHLRPNGNWRGFRAGQHVLLTLEVDGRRCTRAYSLAGAETARDLRLTVGLHERGVVSGWIHRRLAVGDVVELSLACGDFVLPDDPRTPLLLIAGGTGVTPFLGMVRTLAARDALHDVVLLVYAPAVDDVIARDELRRLAAAHAGLRLHVATTRPPHDADLAGHFAPAHLARVAPDAAARITYVCGPLPLARAVADVWDDRGLAHRLRRESFGWRPTPQDTVAPVVSVTCTRSRRTVSVSTAEPLLVALERAGMRPRHGCRAGICRQCTCTLTDGAVEDVRDGRSAAEPGQPIRLCVSRARTDLTLAV